VVLSPMWMIPGCPPLGDPTVVSEPMIQQRIRPAPCIESFPDKGGQAACPVEAVTTAVQVQVYVDEIASARGGA
ncbi:hypothetical protein A2U01_0058034, partial [Trifolium medium]|nr:hypothetical protein [Trifolium medium]